MSTPGSPIARLAAIAASRAPDPASPRAKLMAAAFALFYAQGVRAVGVDRLVGSAGVAKATFYRQFGSKEKFVLSYIDATHDAMLAWLTEETRSRAGDARDHILAVFDALARLVTDPAFRGCPVINTVIEVGQEVPEVVARTQAAKRNFTAWMIDLATAAGLPDPVEVGNQLTILFDGGLVAAGRGDRNAARTARAIVERLLQAS